MIIPLFVNTLMTYNKENEIIQAQASQFIQQSVSQIKGTLDTNLSEIDRLTWSILYQQDLDFLDRPLNTDYELNEANRAFRNKAYSDLFSGKLNHIRTVSFVTADCHVLSTDSSMNAFSKLNQQNFDYIVALFDAEPLKMYWVGSRRTIYQTQTGFDSPVHASATAARRIVDSNTGQLRGYLFIQFNDLFLEEYLSKVRIGSTGSFQVTDESGEAIYKQPSDLLNHPRIIAAIQQLPPNGSGTRVVDGKWMLSYDTSEVSEWNLTAVVPLNEVLGPNRQILRYLLVMTALGAILSVIIALLFTSVISRPVIGLAKVMTMASMNNLNLRENMSSIQEISILQRNFNRLMDRIQELMAENERQQKEQGAAQLKTLQMQIQPHFLYNTLDTIYWMSKKHQAEPISKLVTALGKFFRFTLGSGLDRVTMKRELDHVDNYLRILSFRYRDKLEYDMAIGPDLDDAMIMPLILQPLVENAIEHGIAKLKTVGLVRIAVYRSEHEVVIEVENDGEEADTDRIKRLLEDTAPSEHVGLRNVQQRIKLSFGEAYGIRLAEHKDGKTLIRLCIPFIRHGSPE